MCVVAAVVVVVKKGNASLPPDGVLGISDFFLKESFLPVPLERGK